VSRGFFDTRARAQAAIAAGGVTVEGAPARKPSQIIRPGMVLTAEQPHPYVSRGGVKLAAALDAFGIDPAGQTCLDIGSSTGGFTDCLLQRGAAHVVAVDVGTAQLHASLRPDPRIHLFEQTDIRKMMLEPGLIPTLVVIDVSFIGLRDVLPAATHLAAPAATLVALIKPQFEAGRKALKKGIVRDDAIFDAVIGDIGLVMRSLGWRNIRSMPSPITGGDGNREFLITAERGG
jgi:23S rRNA (cytidine1920-2'-O)/16S rRNA (cytidine1409-2'-O)-methyltransferase